MPKFMDAWVELSLKDDQIVMEKIREINAAAKGGDTGKGGAGPVWMKDLKGDLNALDKTIRQLDAGISKLFEGRGKNNPFREMAQDAKAAGRAIKDVERDVNLRQKAGLADTRSKEVEHDIRKRFALEKDMEDSSYRAFMQGKKDRASVARQQAAWEQDAAKKPPPVIEPKKSPWQHTLDLAAGGAPPRRVFAALFAAAFGDSQVAQALGGVFGMVAGGMALQIGFTITQALMQAPGIIFGERERQGRLTTGFPKGGTLSAEWASAFAENRGVWASSPEGKEKLRGAYQLAENRGMKPDYAKRRINQLLTIAEGSGEGSPEELVSAWMEMTENPWNVSSQGSLAQHPSIRRALQNRLHVTPYFIERQAGRGIGPENINQAIEDAALRDPNISNVGRVAGETGSGSVKAKWRGALDDILTAATDPIDAFWEAQASKQKAGWSIGRQIRDWMVAPPIAAFVKAPEAADVTKMSGMEGAGGGGGAGGGLPPGLNELRPNVHMPPKFQFSTLAGLAEMMQMQSIPSSGPEAKTAEWTEKTFKVLDERLPGANKPHAPDKPAPAFGK